MSTVLSKFLRYVQIFFSCIHRFISSPYHKQGWDGAPLEQFKVADHFWLLNKTIKKESLALASLAPDIESATSEDSATLLQKK